MISVQPFLLFFRQHLLDNRSLINRAQSQRFKLQEPPTFRFLRRNNQQHILYPYPETPLQIDTRLISNRHASTQAGRYPFHPDLMRSLMDIQVGADTMSSTMQIVIASLPHVFPGNGIQLCPTGFLREMKHLQLDMPFQYQGIHLPLPLRKSPQSNRTGNIRRTVLILCPTVKQQESLDCKAVSVSGVAS